MRIGSVGEIRRARWLIVLWAVVLAPIILLCSVPTSTASQTFFGLSAVVIVLALKNFADRLTARVMLLAVASLVVMRYWVWRILRNTAPARA